MVFRTRLFHNCRLTTLGVVVLVVSLMVSGLAPGSAAAAVAARLNGTFDATGTVTEAVNIVNEQVGFTAKTVWRFQASCATGPCQTTLTRKIVSTGQEPSYTLTPDGAGVYAGSGTRSSDCLRSDGSVLMAGGYTVKDSIAVSPTAVDPHGDASAWTAELTAHGDATQAGIDAGCAPSQEVITYIGTVPAPANQAPTFTSRPSGTVYPTGRSTSFQVIATDPEQGIVTLSWSLLPLQPVTVTCANTANPAVTAIVTCTLTPKAGVNFAPTITFTATDPLNATTRVPVTVGPAFHVGMGDSYASGEGNPPFDVGTDTPSNFPLNNVAGSCHRSKDSWQQWIDVDTPFALEKHMACSGANTEAMLAPAFKGETGQVEALRRLEPKPNIITLTVGGNDAKFGDMVGACYLQGRKPACPLAIAQTNVEILRNLRAKLIKTYDAVHAAAPGATIFVVGYPDIVSTGGTATAHCPWITAPNLLLLSGTAAVMNSTIRQTVAAVASTDRVVYVSTLDALKGHELCTGNSWVKPIQLDPVHDRNGTYAYSAHPNDRGQQAIRARVSAAVNNWFRTTTSA